MTVIEKIKAELKSFEEKKTAFLAELQKEFPTMFKELFEKSKRITSIGWTQYTPYFNDGDTCEFSINVDDLYVNGEYEDEIEWLDWRMKYILAGDGDTDKYKEQLKDKELDYEEYKVLCEFKSVLQSIPEEFYKDLFGDHVQVTIKSDGTINKEEYEHD